MHSRFAASWASAARARGVADTRRVGSNTHTGAHIAASLHDFCSKLLNVASFRGSLPGSRHPYARILHWQAICWEPRQLAVVERIGSHWAFELEPTRALGRLGTLGRSLTCGLKLGFEHSGELSLFRT